MADQGHTAVTSAAPAVVRGQENHLIRTNNHVMKIDHAHPLTLLCVNMANISETSLSWQQLVARIRELFSSDDIDIDEVKEAMAAYHTDQKDWSTIATFDAHRYVVMVQLP